MYFIINAGSSSLKYKIFDTQLKEIDFGYIENIKDHKKTLPIIINKIKKYQITTIGHRVVHGSTLFTKPTIITNKEIQQLEKIHLAPLHNPIQIEYIKACKDNFPHIPNIAVFDTAFYKEILPENYRYALPKEWYQKYKIRKYGFHGISHQFLFEEIKKKYKGKYKKIITCHLGNGGSITAIKNEKVVETSMGFTPTGGIVMSTRCGDIDPAILPYIIKQTKVSPNFIDHILNYKSGLLALSESTGDMKTLLEKEKKDPKAKVAIAIYINQIVKFIGAYIALMNGIDCIVFSGTIGERSSIIRNRIKKQFTYLSGIHYITIATNEELMIGREIQNLEHQNLHKK